MQKCLKNVQNVNIVPHNFGWLAAGSVNRDWLLKHHVMVT